jgi:hypothetical protein
MIQLPQDFKEFFQLRNSNEVMVPMIVAKFAFVSSRGVLSGVEGRRGDLLPW